MSWYNFLLNLSNGVMETEIKLLLFSVMTFPGTMWLHSSSSDAISVSDDLNSSLCVAVQTGALR